jgi:hypothetical protein
MMITPDDVDVCKGSLAAILIYNYVIRFIMYTTLSLASPVPYSISLLYHNLLTNTGFSTPLSPFNIKGFDYTQT